MHSDSSGAKPATNARPTAPHCIMPASPCPHMRPRISAVTSYSEIIMGLVFSGEAFDLRLGVKSRMFSLRAHWGAWMLG